MAAPERWWVVGGPILRTGRSQWKIVTSPSRPVDQGDFVYGPYPTRALAEARLRQVESPITPPNPIRNLNPFTDIGKIGHWLGDVVLHITDGAMWRSLGWLGLGALLVIAGIYLWFRTSATYKDLQSAVTGTVKAL